MEKAVRDSYGRTIEYMRISITDRCNLRCRYCMPDGAKWIPMSEILTYEEIERICREAVRIGITRFKITGGEPLVRKGCADLIRTIAGKLTEYQAENIVVDPVMVSTSGARLISEEAIETLKEKLFPLATVITPNIPEAEVLADMEIETVQDMEKAAEVIGTRYGCSVLLKGGHQKNDASDLLWQKDKKPVWFHGVRIDNPNTHGTGCTLSSAIASNLAKGRDLETSVEAAKRYISGALAAMLDLGSGSGPMNHGFAIKEEW